MEKLVPFIFLKIIRLPFVNMGARLTFRKVKKRILARLPKEIPLGVESFFVHDLIENIDTAGNGKKTAFRLVVTNAWFNQNVTGIQAHINGKTIDPAKILVDNDFAKVRGHKINSIRFIAGHPFSLIIENMKLGRGLNFIGLELECELANIKIPLLPILFSRGKFSIPLLDMPWDNSLDVAKDEIDTTDPKMVHFCPHIHYDYEWLRTAGAFSKVAGGNLEKAVAILEKNPESTLVIDQVPQIAALYKASPEAFSKLLDFVKEGRVEPVLGGYVEPDTNLPLGESLVRQFIKWQEFSKANFNKYSKTAWLIDSFGMNGQLPQILRKCGAGALMFSRERPSGSEVKSDFWWQGIDGTPIKTHHMAQSYFAGYPVDSGPKRALYRFSRIYSHLAKSSDQKNLFCPSGTDHGRPQSFAPSMINKWTNENSSLAEFKYSTPSEYLETLDEEEFGSYQGELNGVFTGVSGARVALKQLTRETQNSLLEAETLTAIHSIVNQNSDAAQGNTKSLDDGWEMVMKSLFHDSIAGCVTDEVAKEIENRLNDAKRIGEEVKRDIIQGLVKRIHGKFKGNDALFIFNPTPFARREVIEIDLKEVNGRLPNITDGKRFIAYQILATEHLSEGEIERAKVCFKAFVPPLGYKVFYLTCAGDYKKPFPFFPVTAKGHVLENGQLQIRFSRKTGAISHVIAKESGRIWELGNCGGLQLKKDKGTLYQERLTGFTKKQKLKKIRVKEKGPFRGVIETQGTIGKSGFTTTYTLCVGSAQVSINTKIDFNDPGKALFAKISSDPYQYAVHAEIPFGSIKRETGSGIAQRFFHVEHNNQRSMSVFNTGTTGYIDTGKEVKLILHRSVDGIHFHKGGPGAFGLGRKNFNYALRFSDGDIKDHQPWRFALFFNHKLITFPIPSNHKKGADSELTEFKHCFAYSDAENVIISSMVPDRDGSLLIRCYETLGQSTGAKLSLGFGAERALLTDMLGREASKLEIQDNVIPLDFRAFEIKTLRIVPTRKAE